MLPIEIENVFKLDTTTLNTLNSIVNNEHVFNNEHVTTCNIQSTIVIMTTFGEKLRAWRESKGISTWQFEKLSGITRPNLVSIEKGRRAVGDKILMKIAAIKELDINYNTLKGWQMEEKFGASPLWENQELLDKLPDDFIWDQFKKRFPEVWAQFTAIYPDKDMQQLKLQEYRQALHKDDVP